MELKLPKKSVEVGKLETTNLRFRLHYRAILHQLVHLTEARRGELTNREEIGNENAE